MSDEVKLYEVVLSDKISPENCAKFGCPKTSHVLILSENGDFHDSSKDFVGYVYEHGTKKYIWNDKWYYQTDLPNSADFAQYLRDISSARNQSCRLSSTLRGVDAIGPIYPPVSAHHKAWYSVHQNSSHFRPKYHPASNPKWGSGSGFPSRPRDQAQSPDAYDIIAGSEFLTAVILYD